MIIELCNSIGDSAENLSDIELQALQALAISRVRGFNFIHSEKSNLINIIKNSELGRPELTTFKKILSDQTKWYNLLSELKFRVKVTISSDDVYEEDSNGVNVLVIPLSKTLDYKLDDKATIIAENLIDIEFYTLMSKCFLIKLGVKRLNLDCNKISGGGNNTKDTLKQYYNGDNGVSICVLDSDYIAPWSDFGCTAKNVIDTIPKQPYSKYITTQSREAENIIPFNIISEFYRENKIHKKHIESYKRLSKIKIEGEHPVKYVDFKKGIKNQLTKANCKRTRIYWQQVFEATNLAKPCNKDIVCKSIKSCQCELISGFGTDLLKHTVLYLKENGFDYKEIDNHIKDEWNHICNTIIPYLASPMKQVG